MSAYAKPEEKYDLGFTTVGYTRPLGNSDNYIIRFPHSVGFFFANSDVSFDGFCCYSVN